jgi:hypothetical protein
MTAVLATDALAPVAGLLDLTYPGAYPAGLRLDARPGPPWRTGAELTDPDQLEAVVGTVMRRYGATRHVAAALLWKTYTYRVVSPVVLGWALNRRVPLAIAERTLVRPGPGDNRLSTALIDPTVAVLPGDPLAGTPGTLTVPDEDALLAAAAQALFEEHLIPAVATFVARCKIGRRPLWGSVAEAVAHPLLIASPRTSGGLADVGPPPVRTQAGRLAQARRLLDGLGHGLADLLDLRPAPDGTPYRRRTCCLAFALPQYDYCATCCVPASLGTAPLESRAQDMPS